jgi:integrase
LQSRDAANVPQDAPADVAVYLNRKQKKFRVQDGQWIRGADCYWVRFYDNDVLGRRYKRSEHLCGLDNVSPDDVSRRLKSFMKKENDRQRSLWGNASVAGQMTLGAYWKTVYFPVIEKDGNHSWSTLNSYQHLWETYCEPVAGKVLTRFSTEDACKFLEALAQKPTVFRGVTQCGLGRNSLSLVRTICSGMFTYARTKGVVTANPMNGAKLYVKIRKPEKQVFYTLEEVDAVLNAQPIDGVAMRLDARLLFSFCARLGMRPSEAAAVRWEDITGDELSIERAAPRGHLGETKTENSKGTIWVIPPVMVLLNQWRSECGSPTEGFLFRRRNGSVINVANFTQQYILAYGKAAIGARWRGLYAGRRSVGKLLFNLTGDVRASWQQLRNELATTMAHYTERDSAAARSGQHAVLAEIERKRLAS